MARESMKPKILIRYAMLTFAAVMCLLLSSCAKETDAAHDSGIYAGDISEADVFIDIPNLRQYGGYTCGTTCVQMLMNRLRPYMGDLNLAEYERLLGTSEENGTLPQNILDFFAENDVEAAAKDNMTISGLTSALKQGHPVLMCIQAWSASEEYNTDDPDDTDTYLTEGHWVICVGYKKQESGCVFYFNDPACVGYCLMDEENLDKRWIDMDFNGIIYDHYGIEIAESAPEYDPRGAFYLK